LRSHDSFSDISVVDCFGFVKEDRAQGESVWAAAKIFEEFSCLLISKKKKIYIQLGIARRGSSQTSSPTEQRVTPNSFKFSATVSGIVNA